MIVFLETLSAILVAAKILKMADLTVVQCVSPLIISAVFQISTAVFSAILESSGGDNH